MFDSIQNGGRLAEQITRGPRLRILHVSKLYAPCIGGIETVVKDIVEDLQLLPDLDCEVLVCRDRGSRTISRVNGVKVTRVESAGRFLSTPIAPRFPLQLRTMAGEFDIVHVHVPFPLPILCDWSAIRSRGVRLIIHYHSDIIRPVQRALLGSVGAFERRFMESADRIIVTSEGLLKNSQTLAPYQDKCDVVPLAIDLTRTGQLSAAELAEARTCYGVGVSDRVILFAGRLVYYKGLPYLIEAVRNLDAKLLIVGEGPLRASLEKQIRDSNLGGRVRLLGRVTDSELTRLYSLADLFVLPSTEPSEAFGIVQLEAMAHGLPVVNTNLPSGVPSVSLDGVTGLTVAPADSSALRSAISAILTDDSLRERFSANAQQRVLLFSRPAVLNRIRAIYDELVLQR